MTRQKNKFNSLIFLFFSIILLLTACDNRPKGVLSQREMTEVLIDIHKLDASLNEIGLQYGHYPDKVPYYNNLLLKHGITEAIFDSSLVWYTKNPIKFERVYDDVILALNEQENQVKRGKYHFIDSVELAKVKENIWNKRNKYVLTKDSTRTQLNFEIKNSNLLYGDVYILKFLQRIAPKDSCSKRYVFLQINYSNGRIQRAYALAHNDSLLRRFKIELPANKKLKIKSIAGKLLGSKNYKGKLNVFIDSVSLIRKYNPGMQDSLRNVVEKANPIKSIKHFKSENIRRLSLSYTKTEYNE